MNADSIARLASDCAGLQLCCANFYETSGSSEYHGETEERLAESLESSWQGNYTITVSPGNSMSVVGGRSGNTKAEGLATFQGVGEETFDWSETIWDYRYYFNGPETNDYKGTTESRYTARDHYDYTHDWSVMNNADGTQSSSSNTSNHVWGNADYNWVEKDTGVKHGPPSWACDDAHADSCERNDWQCYWYGWTGPTEAGDRHYCPEAWDPQSPAPVAPGTTQGGWNYSYDTTVGYFGFYANSFTNLHGAAWPSSGPLGPVAFAAAGNLLTTEDDTCDDCVYITPGPSESPGIGLNALAVLKDKLPPVQTEPIIFVRPEDGGISAIFPDGTRIDSKYGYIEDFENEYIKKEWPSNPPPENPWWVTTFAGDNGKAIQGVAEGVGIAAATTAPGVGEAMDIAVFFDPESSYWDWAGAGGSLALSFFTGGVSPNYGGVVRGGKRVAKAIAEGGQAANKLGDAAKAGKAVKKSPSVRPQVNTNLSRRVTRELPAGQTRTPEEVAQARNFFERNRPAAEQWWSDRNGGTPWPKNATHAEHPRALKDGGDPLFIEPGFHGPARPHIDAGDFQRWGRMGGRPPIRRE